MERDGPPSLALFFTLPEALEARMLYEREISACLREGWEVVGEPAS